MALERARAFADLLREYRRAAGLSQEELAERAGLSERALRKLESGESQTPRRDTLALLAAALSLSSNDRTLLEATVSRHRKPIATVDESTVPVASATGLRSTSALVGRAAELAVLEQHLVGEGPPLLLLAGEPGVGKTRLLREAAARAGTSGWCVLEGGCYQREGQEPYAPVLGALARYVRQHSSARLRADLTGCSWLVRLLPELAEASLVPVPQWTLPSDQERRLMFVAVGRFLANVAGPAGTLLVLDDLQWAGPDALDLLSTLLRLEPQRPLRIIGAYRSTEVRPEHALAAAVVAVARDGLAEQLILDPLDAREAAALLDSLLEGADGIEAGWPERVLRWAGGVPFYLVSCARAVRAGALKGGSTPAVPWDVAETIRQRVVVLPAGAKELLSAAAVIGGTMAGTLLAAVAEQTEEKALDSLRATCEARLLVDEGEDAYRFAHDLVREMVEADLGAARRKLLHRRAAEAIERAPGEPAVERLAYHYARGGEPEKAVIYLERAGDRAQTLFAHAEAEGYYRKVVDQFDGLRRVHEAAQTREKLAATLISQARYDEALSVLERAVALHRGVGNQEGFWRATTQMGWVHAAKGTPEEGLACLEPLYASPAEHEPTLGRAVLQAALAHLYLHTGQYGQAVTAAERAAEVSRTAGHERLLNQAETSRGTALLYLGRAMEARQVLEGALTLAEAAGDLSDLLGALQNAGDASIFLGEFDTCKRYVERALALAERTGEPSAIASAVYRHGVISYHLGDWARGRLDFERAMRMIGQANNSWLSMPLSLYLGKLGLAEGQREASQQLDAVIDLLERQSERTALLHAYSLLAERDLLEGHAEVPLARLEPLRQQPSLAESVGAIEVFSLLAWAYLATGEEAQAEVLLTQCLQPANAERNRPAWVGALWVRAMLATRRRDWITGEAALEEALALCRAMPYPYAEAKALYVYGQLLAARGEPERAREQYEAALAICEKLGEGLYRPHIERAVALVDVTRS
jgi:tetratricopeptide (TPR) repeat protein/transcriptional regulator with XRE-family HTH domain